MSFSVNLSATPLPIRRSVPPPPPGPPPASAVAAAQSASAVSHLFKSTKANRDRLRQMLERDVLSQKKCFFKLLEAPTEDGKPFLVCSSYLTNGKENPTPFDVFLRVIERIPIKNPIPFLLEKVYPPPSKKIVQAVIDYRLGLDKEHAFTDEELASIAELSLYLGENDLAKQALEYLYCSLDRENYFLFILRQCLDLNWTPPAMQEVFLDSNQWATPEVIALLLRAVKGPNDGIKSPEVALLHKMQLFPEVKILPELEKTPKVVIETWGAEARALLGLCYWRGMSVERDLSRGFDLLKRSAEQGSLFGEVLLGCFYQENQNQQAALTCFAKAEEGGSILGGVYATCIRGADEKAFDKLREFAAQGNLYAMVQLGLCWRDGLGVGIFLPHAFVWFQKAARQGSFLAMAHLGYCYLEGMGTPKNRAHAFYWFKKAAEGGNPLGMNGLVFCYTFGVGIEREPDGALYWFKKVVERGISPSLENPAVCYRDQLSLPSKERFKQIDIWKENAKKGDIQSEAFLGLCYLDGYLSSDEDLDDDYDLPITPETYAFCSLQKAAEQGAVMGKANFGFCWFQGICQGVDSKKAFHHFKEAAELGSPVAMASLAFCYRDGIGSVENQDLAFTWYRKAAIACYLLSADQVKLCVETSRKESKRLLTDV